MTDLAKRMTDPNHSVRNDSLAKLPLVWTPLVQVLESSHHNTPPLPSSNHTSSLQNKVRKMRKENMSQLNKEYRDKSNAPK